LVAAETPQDDPGKDLILQGRPVRTWFQAVKDGDKSITHKQKKLPGLRVIEEENAWKVDER
jgi:hypothetical protein